MGNEHSKNKGPSKISQCDKNGGLNGLAANITTNGLDIDAKTLNQNQQNGKAAALNSATESDYVVIHSDSQQVEVIPEKPATTPETEEADKHEERVQLFDKIFKKKAEREAPIEAENVVEEETHQNIVRDASLPATDTQLESSSSREDADTTSAPKEEDYLHHQVESSTQTDREIEANISTQTGDDAKRTSPTKVPVGEMERTDRTKEPSESDIVIAEEAFEESIQEESPDNQAAGITVKETTVNVIYEDVFRAERMEVIGECEIQNPEKGSLNDSHEIDPEIPVQCKPVESTTEIPEEVNVPQLQEGEGGSTDERLLSEAAEAEVIIHDNKGRNDIPSVNVEPLITMMETISEEEEHLILERTEPVCEKGINIDHGYVVLEDSSEGSTAWHKELSTIDEVPEYHFDQCLWDTEVCTDKHIDVTPVTNTESDIPADGNRTEKEIQEETVAPPSQNPDYGIATALGLASDSHLELQANPAVRFVSSFAHQETVPPNSESTFVETIIGTNNKLTSGESTQKETKAVLGSLDEDVPIQGSSSQCEVTEASVQAVAYRSELLIKIPAVPKQAVEETIIPTQDDMHFEEFTQKETEVELENIHEDTFVKEFSSDCNVTNTFGEAGFCSQPPTEISETTKVENVTPAPNYAEKSTQMETDIVIKRENTHIHQSSDEASLEAVAEAKCPPPLDQTPPICKPIAKDAQNENDFEDFNENGVALWNVHETMTCEAQIISEGSSSEDECFGTLNKILENADPTVKEMIISAKDESHFEETSSENPAISDVPKEENDSPPNDQGLTVIMHFVEGMFENLDVCQIRHRERCDLQLEPLTEEDLDSCSSVHEEQVEENSVVQTEETRKPDAQESLSLIDMEAPLSSGDPSQEITSLPEHQPTILKTSGFIEEADKKFDKHDACVASSTCFKTVIKTIVGEIISPDAVEAESCLRASEDEAPEMNSEAESSVDTTEISPTEGWSNQKLEDQEHMEALLGRLESSCASVVEESPYRLEGFDISSSGHNIIVVIQVASEEE
ncbi:breast carcinoma-amplified sequence 1 isoform X1 [Hippocampus comes]|uniref:breast carcinoma-amplified sequence 1 isoform X1 n=1 Tax=Hippocampus comes TaxID=109280 RepID=UPI00094F1040|nr:PREDICTED: uncharacterized protein LOC109513679 isoform X1 [Hippocampus comes]